MITNPAPSAEKDLEMENCRVELTCDGGVFTCQKPELESRIAKLEAALKDIFKMMDEEIIVRNIDDDAKPDFHIRMLGFVSRMKAAHGVLDE